MTVTQYNVGVKTLTVRLPETLIAEIETESQQRNVSKSDVIRERLQADTGRERMRSASFKGIADLVGSIADLPPDLSMRKKDYLKASGYGRKRPR